MKTKFILFASLLVLLTGYTCRIGGPAANDGGVFRSSDRGETWTQKVFVSKEKKKTVTIGNVDTRVLLFEPGNSSTIYLASEANGLYRSIDSGDTWSKTGLNIGRITSLDINPDVPKTIYATTGQSLFRSTDGGDKWSSIYTNTLANNNLFNTIVDFFDTQRIYLTDNIGSIYKSYDGGDSWQTIKSFNKPVSILKMNPIDSRKLYAAIKGGGFQYSGDGGVNWLSLQDGLKKYQSGDIINAIAFDPVHGDTVYLGTNYGLLKSIDNGLTWQEIPTLIKHNTQSIRTVTIDPISTQRIYISTDTIVYRSDDGGQTWKSLKTIKSTRTITQLLVNPDQSDVLYAGVLFIKK
ncbi:MAG: hypothetical protein WC734_00620 [Patescibacteria group bacterium]|jgi:photosystem II stability/assembly factor-like uncharacterized protein